MSEEQQQCPLVTEYATAEGMERKLRPFDALSPDLLEKLFLIRKWPVDPDNPDAPIIPFNRPKTVRDKIWNIVKDAETDQPLVIKEFQKQAIHHLIRMPRFILGDAVGLGKTLSALVAFAWLKERNPDAKMVVVTTKSTTYQWADECRRFTTLRPFVMQDTYGGLKGSEARYSQMMKFFEGDKKDILIVKYDSLKGRRRATKTTDHEGNEVVKREKAEEIDAFGAIMKQHREKTVLVFDECHRFKSEWTQTRNLVWVLSRYPERVWALTATVIKNGMDEFYSIATAIGIRPLGWMKDFHDAHCIFREQYVGNGQHKKILVGYQKVPVFKRELRPFFFGRSQPQVKEPLPRLSTIYHPIDLDPRQTKILTEDLPSGAIQLPPILFKVAGEWREKERDPDNLMTQLSVQQLVTNHWCMLDRNNEKEFLTKALSPKEEALLDLIDGDYRGEKVVAYAQPLTAKILTPSGWRFMGNMKVGDEVIDPDTGGTAYVEGVFPQGMKPVYALKTQTGCVTECTGDHLWAIQTYSDHFKRRNNWRVWTTDQMREFGILGVNESTGRNYSKIYLPVSQAVDFSVVHEDSLQLPIPAYTLGVLLGDGSTIGAVEFTVSDHEIVDRVKSQTPSGLQVKHSGGIRYRISTPEQSRIGGANEYLNALRVLGIQGTKAPRKFIPQSYLHASMANRKDLLAGLLDTDGSCKQDGQVTFGTTSNLLAADMVELVRSLGGLAKISGPYQSKLPNRNPCWHVGVWVPFNPFNLRRKQLLWKLTKKLGIADTVASIEFVGYKECQCIRVSSKRSLYLTDDYIPTHNTKYRSWIDRLQWLTDNGHFTERKFLRITGAENEKKRAENKQLFQDPDSGYDLIVVNAAGIEGINLQQAAHMILLDVPWSWGDLIQLVGRMVRMASPHSACTLHIMVAKGTVDEYAIETLRGKKGVFETILGDSHSAGILDSGENFNLDSGMEGSATEEEFKAMLKAHIKRIGMKVFLSGDQINRAQSDIQYKMVFERGSTGKKKNKVSYEEIKWFTE